MQVMLSSSYSRFLANVLLEGFAWMSNMFTNVNLMVLCDSALISYCWLHIICGFLEKFSHKNTRSY